MSSQKYLKITNNGTVSRKYLELLGASDKRERFEDSSVIGNKGSGAKLAPIPAMRMGMEVVVSSADIEGPYLLRYETQKADLGNREMQQVVFNYIGHSKFPSQLTTDAFRDWDAPIGDDKMRTFKILREYVCNAWDEDKGFTIEKVNEISLAEEGKTSVYISINEEIEEMLGNITRYFKFISGCKPVHVSTEWGGKGSIFEKSQPQVTRLFSQGVMVDCKSYSGYSSLYDYSLDDKHLLSEERVIKDFSEYVNGIGSLLVSIRSQETIHVILLGMIKEKANLEMDALERIKNVPYEAAAMFRNAWQEIYGDKSILPSGTMQVDGDAEALGFTLIRGLDSSLRKFLQRCGISSARDVAPSSRNEKNEPTFKELQIDQLEEDRKAFFNRAHGLFLKYYPDAKQFTVHIFRPVGWQFERAGGHCGEGPRRFREIWINESSLKSVRDILEILLHEARHCLTKAEDYDRRFTQAADAELVEFMLSNATPPKKNIWVAEVIPGRGIIFPRRFVGSNAQVFVSEREIFIRFCGEGVSTQIAHMLEKPVEGRLTQSRKVTRHNKMGCVFLPQSILECLPQKLEVIIN
jgi:hypothetical protein